MPPFSSYTSGKAKPALTAQLEIENVRVHSVQLVSCEYYLHTRIDNVEREREHERMWKVKVILITIRNPIPMI